MEKNTTVYIIIILMSYKCKLLLSIEEFNNLNGIDTKIIVIIPTIEKINIEIYFDITISTLLIGKLFIITWPLDLSSIAKAVVISIYAILTEPTIKLAFLYSKSMVAKIEIIANSNTYLIKKFF